MIDGPSFTRFLSGRLVGLLILLGIQVAVVRLLTPGQYALYALVMAFASLLQTLTSFGLPRVAARFVSGAGETLSRRWAKRLALGLLGARVVGCALALGVSTPIFVALNAPWPLLWAGAAYSLASTMQMDADGLTLALGLQVASRRAAVGEPLTRVALILAWAAAGAGRTAVVILWIGAASALAASSLLILAVLKTLSKADDPACAARAPDWSEIRAVAVGGYGGTLSWLILSPAVIRLIAGRVLPTEVFAGFSFVQTLVVSAQRYAPSFILFPLVEPAALADAARTGRPDRLRAALRLLVKSDAVAVGAAIAGLSVAGAPILLLLTKGRYGEAAAFLPWLLLGIVANASHRSYEVAAIAAGASAVLTRSLGLTALWFAAMVSTAPALGVWPLLLCPLGDALTRLWLVGRTLARAGMPDLVDLKRLGAVGASAGLASLAALAMARLMRAGPLESVGVGAAASAGFLAVMAVVQPFGSQDVELLGAAAPWLLKRLHARRRDAQSPLRVTILTPRGQGAPGGVDRLMDSLRPLLRGRADVAVHFVTTRGRSRWASLAVSLAALIRLAAASALGRADMIHVNLGAHMGCYRKMALIAIPRLFGTPYVLHLHGSGFDRFWTDAPPFARRRIDRLFRDAAQVIVLGDKWRRLVVERDPDVAPRVTVLPNATPLFAGVRTPCTDHVTILFLGELTERKGAAVLIEALASLKTKTPWRAVIAGDGDLATARRAIQRFGLDDRVELPGWIDGEAVQAQLAAADILALPSLEENLPMAVIEAFSAGLAVIATPVGAVPDILKHGDTGWMTPPGGMEELAQALSALIDDPPLRRRLGEAAKAYHGEHLALAPYVDRLIQAWRRHAE